MKIKINEINKLEGHISFSAALDKGDVKSAKITVEEGARMIEGILIGRNYYEAPIITARICGICPVVHNLTSIKAIENALGLKVSPHTESLRKVMLSAQIIQSHALHLYFCSLPDFFRLSDNFKLLKKFPEEGKKGIVLRNFANKVVEIIGGRAIHPINSVVGGFNVLPNKHELNELKKEASKMLKTAIELANVFEKLKYPKFLRETEYISLTDEKEYGFYGGKLVSRADRKKRINADDFLNFIREDEADGVEKRTTVNGQSYMIGALARIYNNHAMLCPQAKKIFDRHKKELLSYNTFYNILAQAIETVHFLELMANELNRERKETLPKCDVALRAGKGAAISEAPRGILYHQYELDVKGKIIGCNIITPTVQFLNNMEDDLAVFLQDKKNLTPEKIKFMVRAYDPCISCATH